MSLQSPGMARETSGLYYKHIMIVIDAASVVRKWCSKL